MRTPPCHCWSAAIFFCPLFLQQNLGRPVCGQIPPKGVVSGFLARRAVWSTLPGCWLTDWLVVEAWLIERSGFRMEGLTVNSEELKSEDFSGSDKVLTAASISAFCYHTHTLTDTWRTMMWCSVMVCDEVHLLSAAHMLWMTFHTKLPWASSVAVGKLPIREVNLNASCLQKLISTWSLAFTLK